MVLSIHSESAMNIRLYSVMIQRSPPCDMSHPSPSPSSTVCQDRPMWRLHARFAACSRSGGPKSAPSFSYTTFLHPLPQRSIFGCSPSCARCTHRYLSSSSASVGALLYRYAHLRNVQAISRGQLASACQCTYHADGAPVVIICLSLA